MAVLTRRFELQAMLVAMLVCLAPLWGCAPEARMGCSSDDDCRLGRVCGADGMCAWTDDDEEPDAAGDVDDDVHHPDAQHSDVLTNNFPMFDVGPDDGGMGPDTPDRESFAPTTTRIHDYCDGATRRTLFVFADEPFECGMEPELHISVEITSALDMESQTPGEFSWAGQVEGLRAVACTRRHCVDADSGRLQFRFYQPGEIAQASWSLFFPVSAQLSPRLSGQRFDFTTESLGGEWCSFPSDECR